MMGVNPLNADGTSAVHRRIDDNEVGASEQRRRLETRSEQSTADQERNCGMPNEVVVTVW